MSAYPVFFCRLLSGLAAALLDYVRARRAGGHDPCLAVAAVDARAAGSGGVDPLDVPGQGRGRSGARDHAQLDKQGEETVDGWMDGWMDGLIVRSFVRSVLVCFGARSLLVVSRSYAP